MSIRARVTVMTDAETCEKLPVFNLDLDSDLL